MCGIAGILRVHRAGEAPPPPLAAIPEAWLDLLDESIKHRGPDGAGRFRDRAVRPDGTAVDVALVHRRLSIIDHAGGAQPMVLAAAGAENPVAEAPGSSGGARLRPCPRCAALGKTTIAVVFNGCIYNHRELRRELQAAGHEFTTDHSDTEVLVHSWSEWGWRSYSYLDGMFALCLWDGAGGKLAFVRDRCGEKPLYTTWSRADQTGAVSSAVPGLVAFLAHTRPEALRDGPNGRAIFGDSWLWSGGVRCGIPFRAIDEVQPNTTDAFHADNPRGIDDHGYYWNSPYPRGDNPKLTIDAVDQLICDSVRARLEADVPVGVFLSGGIDSSLIAAAAQSEATGGLEMFTVRMPSDLYDESAFAARVAKIIGGRHTLLDCPTHPSVDVVTLIEQLGMPFGDSSLLPTHWVSRAVRQMASVALAGDGGDELFAGYERYRVAALLREHREALAVLPTQLLPTRSSSSRAAKIRRLVNAARYGGYSDLLAIFEGPDVERVRPGVRHWRGSYDGTDPLWSDLRWYLKDDLLRKSDTASMAVALEVRSPLLSNAILDACLAEPISSLMRNGQRKGLLREVARKYFPAEIVDRPKQGFAIPIGEWFRSDFGAMRQLLLDHLNGPEPFGPDRLGVGPMINMTFVKQMLREHDEAGKKSLWPWKGRDHSQRLYMLLVLSIWAKWLARI